MIDKSNIEKTNAWPFVEAKKILKERKKYIVSKGKITLQTGYGPSGLPHIGTFGEVARTSMIVNALNQLTDLPKEIITFSDDMDGLRKIPENIPNKEILKKNLHKPLTSIPDPFKKFKSFGEHNNEMLKKFLNKFKFNYIFRSSTETYKKGIFNNTLLLVLEKEFSIFHSDSHLRFYILCRNCVPAFFLLWRTTDLYMKSSRKNAVLFQFKYKNSRKEQTLILALNCYFLYTVL